MDSDTEFRFCLRIIKAGMEDLFSTFEEKPTAGLSFEKEIAISNLSYAYPEGKRVLKEFDCTIRKGEYIGIRGSSGIGKSTLFNLLLGFLKPDGGDTDRRCSPFSREQEVVASPDRLCAAGRFYS